MWNIPNILHMLRLPLLLLNLQLRWRPWWSHHSLRLPKVKVLGKNLVLLVLLRMLVRVVVRVKGKMGRVKLLLKLEGKMVFWGQMKSLSLLELKSLL
jgi:hypothetical protein